MISAFNFVKYYLGVFYFTYAAIILPGVNIDYFLSNAVKGGKVPYQKN
jgi:hypothetical protein